MQPGGVYNGRNSTEIHRDVPARFPYHRAPPFHLRGFIVRVTFLIRLVSIVTLALALFTPERAWSRPPSAPPSASAKASPSASAAPEAEPKSADPPASPGYAWKTGPAPLDLGHGLDLALPAAYVFLGMPDAAKLLEKNGSFHNEDLLGVVTSEEGDGDWFAVMRYEEAGYVKDDEKIDADELLKAFREGQAEANQERTRRGFSPLTIEGWSELPRYERALHHLVWSLTVSSPDHGQSVNFNTRVLGRKGYVSINLVTAPDKLAAYRSNAATLLGVTRFKAGSRYEDFDQKTDKVAEYGLIGLILGGAGLGAAKLVKVGLLAKFGKAIVAALIAGKKVVVVGLAAVAAFFKRLFGRKKTEG
jgi:uncharacterized membrane-anchored protein